MEALERFIQYLQKENEAGERFDQWQEKDLNVDRPDSFLDKLRLFYEWDDEKFEELIEVIEPCVAAFETEDLLPRCLAAYLSWVPEYIIGISSHPDFIELNARACLMSPEAFKHFLEIRHKRLVSLKRWFFHGTRLSQ